MVILFLLALTPAFAEEDNSVRDAMIKESIRAQGLGDCPCPFNFRPDGTMCGTKSRYDLSNGRSPLCYRTDITVEMVEAYRKRVNRGKE